MCECNAKPTRSAHLFADLLRTSNELILFYSCLFVPSFIRSAWNFFGNFILFSNSSKWFCYCVNQVNFLFWISSLAFFRFFFANTFSFSWEHSCFYLLYKCFWWFGVVFVCLLACSHSTLANDCRFAFIRLFVSRIAMWNDENRNRFSKCQNHRKTMSRTHWWLITLFGTFVHLSWFVWDVVGECVCALIFIPPCSISIGSSAFLSIYLPASCSFRLFLAIKLHLLRAQNLIKSKHSPT